MNNNSFIKQINPPIYPLIAGGGSTFQNQLKEGTGSIMSPAHRPISFLHDF